MHEIIYLMNSFQMLLNFQIKFYKVEAGFKYMVYVDFMLEKYYLTFPWKFLFAITTKQYQIKITIFYIKLST